MRSNWQYLAVTFLLWVIYAGFFLFNPAPSNVGRDLSPTSAGMVKVGVLIPFLVVWLYCVSGWINFNFYAKRSPKGLQYSAFAKLSLGLLILVLNIILPSVIRTIILYFNNDLSQTENWVRINNYVYIYFPLIAFLLMYLGSLDLRRLAKARSKSIFDNLTVLIPVSLFSFFYMALIFTNPARQISENPKTPATYSLSDSLIVLTIVLPVIATWAIGLMLALNLEKYSHQSAVQQKPAMANIYNGVLAIVGAAILTQAILSLGINRFSGGSVLIILFLFYILFAIIALGFNLIERGAKKLLDTESVSNARE